MNKAKLKSYAPQARLDFIAAVTARANLLGLSEKSGHLEVAPAQTQGDVTLIAGQAWPAKVATQREQLVTRMQREGFAQTCEAIAYTWFNRFAALRYMELHDYLDHGHRALSSAEGGLPDILTYASDLAHAGDTGLPGLKAELVTEMKLAGNRDSELYRMLLVAQCNALSRVMPFLFERIDDDSELLLPDNLLRSDSVIAKLVNEIPEEDWAEVEIIGWLYQFYISDKKDQVIGKVVKSEDIPAATQLFTPNWIVQHLVQNSVGRLWMMANPNSTLAYGWPYYIAPAEQIPEVQAQLDALIKVRIRKDGDTLNPENITVLDPACGSGHILVVAYDVLKAIYLERGYQPRAIPRLILEKNLFGLDVDDRAAQMACFALLMKARADDRRLFTALDNEDSPLLTKLNVLSLQESKGLNVDDLATNLAQTNLSHSVIRTLVETFRDAKTFGSLIRIPLELKNILTPLKESLRLLCLEGDMYARAAATDLLPLVRQAQVLAMQFDAVIANPPYLSTKGMTPSVKNFLRSNYSNGEKDIFAAFMIRAEEWGIDESSRIAMVTPISWMYLSSFEKLRRKLLANSAIESLIELETNAFEPAMVTVCSFIFSSNKLSAYSGSFIQLSNFKGAQNQAPKVIQAINERDCPWLFRVKNSRFKSMPGSSIAYAIDDTLMDAFANFPRLDNTNKPCEGLKSGENDLFLRYWFEVDIDSIGANASSFDEFKSIGKRWLPHQKGGEYKRWYGNNEYVIDWNNDGYAIKNHPKSTVSNLNYQLKECATWTYLSTSFFGVRYSPKGFIFGNMGPMVVGPDPVILTAYLCSQVGAILIQSINPTLSFSVGNVASLPYPEEGIKNNAELIRKIAQECIDISMSNWNDSEFSFEFLVSPIIKKDSEKLLNKSFESFEILRESQLQRMKYLEGENNAIFMKLLGVKGNLTSTVSEDQITLTRVDRERDCQRLISYAIGCMMGRYSLDEPGLIYARTSNVDFDPERYITMAADADGIIPITNELWFEGDAPSRIREFLRAVWGLDTLEENMIWLAESLGTKVAETPDETIRRYLADKFFKDHLQTYKKRPIYWLFSSGKQGAFQALVYLHRYNEGTLARMRAEYVVPLTSKIQNRIEMLEKDVSAANSTAARNKLAKEVEKLRKKHVELLAYDEQLRHYADMRIKLNLNDGVKVNYGKFGDLLAEVKAVAGGAGDE